MNMQKMVNGQLVDLTEQEIADLNHTVTYEDASLLVRGTRDKDLQASDIHAFADRITPEWASYRQALRDITAQEGFPYSVIWPTKPE